MSTHSFIKKNQPRNYRSIDLNDVSTKILENISKPLVCPENPTGTQRTAPSDATRTPCIFQHRYRTEVTVLPDNREATHVLSSLRKAIARSSEKTAPRNLQKPSSDTAAISRAQSGLESELQKRLALISLPPERRPRRGCPLVEHRSAFRWEAAGRNGAMFVTPADEADVNGSAARWVPGPGQSWCDFTGCVTSE